MADSKRLYSPDKGLRHLERGLWAALGLLDHRPRTWRDVWRVLAPEALDGPMPLAPWYADYDGPAPLDCHAEEMEPLVEALRVGLAAAGVRLVAVRSRAIFEEEFNELVERHGSKGAALSHQTLALAARMIDPLPARTDLGDLRQARRAEPLWAAAGRAFPRVADRELRRRAGTERVSLRAGRSGAWRSVSARRPNRACPPHWLRWRRNTSANWPCGR